ncbi:MAG TPA: hypothetical protein VH298_03200 [Jatrophihabitans sp.]|nr:hypothetical protein [Jatrophihabitans sp.]
MSTAEQDANFARSVSLAIGAATAFPLDPTVVRSCLDDASSLDQAFGRALLDGLAQLDPTVPRGRLNGVTGHVGESVAEILLVDLGFSPLWHFSGPLSGGHGVDLLMLSPADTVAAVEVKASLRSRRWPRPSRRELTQLSPDWLDGQDNPGMANWDLTGADVHGLVIVVNFADAAWKCAATWDFSTVWPATDPSDLADPGWLTNPGQTRR